MHEMPMASVLPVALRLTVFLCFLTLSSHGSLQTLPYSADAVVRSLGDSLVLPVDALEQDSRSACSSLDGPFCVGLLGTRGSMDVLAGTPVFGEGINGLKGWNDVGKGMEFEDATAESSFAAVRFNAWKRNLTSADEEAPPEDLSQSSVYAISIGRTMDDVEQRLTTPTPLTDTTPPTQSIGRPLSGLLSFESLSPVYRYLPVSFSRGLPPKVLATWSSGWHLTGSRPQEPPAVPLPLSGRTGVVFGQQSAPVDTVRFSRAVVVSGLLMVKPDPMRNSGWVRVEGLSGNETMWTIEMDLKAFPTRYENLLAVDPKLFPLTDSPYRRVTELRFSASSPFAAQGVVLGGLLVHARHPDDVGGYDASYPDLSVDSLDYVIDGEPAGEAPPSPVHGRGGEALASTVYPDSFRVTLLRVHYDRDKAGGLVLKPEPTDDLRSSPLPSPAPSLVPAISHVQTQSLDVPIEAPVMSVMDASTLGLRVRGRTTGQTAFSRWQGAEVEADGLGGLLDGKVATSGPIQALLDQLKATMSGLFGTEGGQAGGPIEMVVSVVDTGDGESTVSVQTLGGHPLDESTREMAESLAKMMTPQLTANKDKLTKRKKPATAGEEPPHPSQHEDAYHDQQPSAPSLEDSDASTLSDPSQPEADSSNVYRWSKKHQHTDEEDDTAAEEEDEDIGEDDESMPLPKKGRRALDGGKGWIEWDVLPMGEIQMPAEGFDMAMLQQELEKQLGSFVQEVLKGTQAANGDNTSSDNDQNEQRRQQNSGAHA
ncbi:unnamed protein product [Vitrella brassicaformis CCMP3155]|uniref:Transmembrane protein n=2 Tax=Vitrella brassicaformis TaxID=1169539 RepID=A0A0G4F216_VITBC|nr:unnamed protein product [Vitrella brassicaformis CCMP3155]|eukprot:CEM05663.1 unnamed protein product [Vitrella brassicaformis CCMP3155]